MALTKVGPAGIGSTPGTGYVIGDSFLHSTGLDSTNAKFTGIVTAQTFRVLGNFQVDGTTTTLDTEVTSVDKLEVAANNTTVGVAITQSGSGDILNLYDGSTEVFTVTDGGLVGIGTVAPNAPLDVFSNTSATDKDLFMVRSATGAFAIQCSSIAAANPEWRLRTYAAEDIVFSPGGTGSSGEKVRIKSNGNVGIGTDTPIGQFHLHKASTSVTQVLECSSGAASFQVRHTNGYGTVNFWASGTEKWRVGQTATSSDFNIYDVPNSAERLRIDSSGNLTAVNTSSGGAVTLKIGANATTGANNGTIIINNGGTGDGALQFDYENSAARAKIYVYRSTQDLIFDTAGSERLRITSDGKVGVGIATPNIFGVHANNSSNSVYFKADSGSVSTVYGSATALGTGVLGTFTNHALAFYTNSTEKLRIDSNGRILVGPGAIATPKCGYAGIDIPNYDYAIVMGGSDGNGNRANNAIKDGRFCGAHYTNAEEPVGIIRYSIGSTASEIHMGGGSSLINAATQLSFYTAANTTTTGGTERLRITSAGYLGINDTSPAKRLTVTTNNEDAVLIKNTNTAQYASARLHLQGPGSTDNVTALVHGQLQSAGGDSYFAIESKTSSHVYKKTLMLYDHNSNHWAFHAGSADPSPERLRITSDGNVAINKTSGISAKLHIGDTGNNAALSQLIKLGNDSSNAGTGAQINMGAANANESTAACIGGFYDGVGTAFIVKTAGTYANQSTVAERLRITSAGGVSICNAGTFNTTAGNETLYIQGQGHNGHGTGNTRSVVSIAGAISSNASGAGLWIGARTNENTAVIGTRTANGHLAFETYSGGWGERMRLTNTGNLGINCTPSANDLASGASFGVPKLHALGNNSQAGAYELLARFQSGTDADNTGSTIVLNHANDRGLALQGGRSSGNRSFGAIKSIDNQGRLSNVMAFSGDNGLGVQYISFYTGNSTSTTSRLHIDSVGNITHNGKTYPVFTPKGVDMNEIYGIDSSTAGNNGNWVNLGNTQGNAPYHRKAYKISAPSNDVGTFVYQVWFNGDANYRHGGLYEIRINNWNESSRFTSVTVTCINGVSSGLRVYAYNNTDGIWITTDTIWGSIYIRKFGYDDGKRSRGSTLCAVDNNGYLAVADVGGVAGTIPSGYTEVHADDSGGGGYDIELNQRFRAGQGG